MKSFYTIDTRLSSKMDGTSTIFKAMCENYVYLECTKEILLTRTTGYLPLSQLKVPKKMLAVSNFQKLEKNPSLDYSNFLKATKRDFSRISLTYTVMHNKKTKGVTQKQKEKKDGTKTERVVWCKLLRFFGESKLWNSNLC